MAKKYKIKEITNIHSGESNWFIVCLDDFEDETMTIPSVIDGHKIKGIGQNAFRGCQIMKRVVVEDGIEVILDNAFSNTSVESIRLPNTLYYLGKEAFKCANLKSIKLPINITQIRESTFSRCMQLSKVEFSPKLKSIDAYAFHMCFFLSDIRFPVGLESIETAAFRYANLKSVYIPSTVKKIGNYLEANVFGSGPWGFTIYCEENSIAMQYARKHGIKCKKGEF